ncbi:MAG: hypothetical protein DMD88_21350 [Candidatus Rokuibacteriota bacterium]|nr:MAG: hypothetical protein DMD88_21350 [Candidatus Rokubacteria bacterium]
MRARGGSARGRSARGGNARGGSTRRGRARGARGGHARGPAAPGGEQTRERRERVGSGPVRRRRHCPVPCGGPGAPGLDPVRRRSALLPGRGTPLRGTLARVDIRRINRHVVLV